MVDWWVAVFHAELQRQISRLHWSSSYGLWVVKFREELELRRDLRAHTSSNTSFMEKETGVQEGGLV